MAELQAYEEVGPVRRDEKHFYDDIKNVNKMDNASRPSWKQYIKPLIIVISVSLMCAVVTYLTVNAQLQRKLDLLETKLAVMEKKNMTNLQETDNIDNLKELAQLQKKLELLETKLAAQLQQKLNLYDDKFANIENKIEETENRNNLTISDLQKKKQDSTEQVAITAHPSSSSTLQGIIKFDNVIFSVGINNLPSYKRTGKFVVEKEGLYMISVAIFSKTNNANYYIHLNGNVISYTRIAFTNSPPSSMSNTGTVVVVRQLHPNDSLWVEFPTNYYIGGGFWSTLTIVKIK